MTLFKLSSIVPCVLFAAAITAVSCGSQEVTELRRYGEAVSNQDQQTNSSSGASSTGGFGDGSSGSSGSGSSGSGTTDGSPSKDQTLPTKPVNNESPGDLPESPETPQTPETPSSPQTPPKVDPTAGDDVQSLRFKTTCYQPGNGSCFLHQSTSSNAGFYERLCRQGSRDAQINKGRNTCADLEITAKCSVNFRGDKLIFYNIGPLTQAKDKELADTCAGTEVLGQVIRGDYERFATPQ